ncbi:AraC family transcriptional regulator [uncultured Croceitalea sp.]|uniref:AraC family transcriptional regulator n=1 Tax=uncultured Croceitalea sp. TaxID=1798908 RepID=UPI003305D1F4
MVYKPQHSEIQKHIDHYWILDSTDLQVLNSDHMYAYPGITPDMIIVLEGQYRMSYMGKTFSSNRSQLFSFIHGEVLIDFSALRRCIIVKFKSRALSSLRPFIGVDVTTIMKDSVAFADEVFGTELNWLENHLARLERTEMVLELDEWFAAHYKKEREGFVVEMSQQVSEHCDLKEIMRATGYSYSTLERYFKRETGLTPKSFQTLKRFKKVLRELYTTKNQDWQHYVLSYGYYDQSHFIKEMKRFTGHSPSELLHIPSFIQVRPDYS